MSTVNSAGLVMVRDLFGAIVVLKIIKLVVIVLYRDVSRCITVPYALLDESLKHNKGEFSSPMNHTIFNVSRFSMFLAIFSHCDSLLADQFYIPIFTFSANFL